MIQNLKIENFRQFDSLEINAFKRINFLVGKNGCGKTSVLEALFIMANPKATYSLVKIFNFRGQIIDVSNISNLFKDLNGESVYLEIRHDSNQYALTISSNDTTSFKIDNDELQLITVESADNESKKVYNYFVNDINDNTKKFTAKLLFDSEQSLSFAIQKDLIPPFHKVAQFLSSRLEILASTINLPSIIENGEEDKVVALLQLFDERINNILLIGNKGIYIELEDKKRLPLSIMGDGLKKYLSIVSSLISGKTSYLLIDEIENGLHYTNIKQLLRAILKLSKELQVQLFITTHSYETLKFLSEVASEDEFSPDKDDIQVVNIAKTKLKGFQSYTYSMDGLIEFIETETEVRD